MKEITILSQGNANSSTTWSNIPYFLVSTLKDKGYKVNPVNVEVSTPIRFLFDKLFCRFLRHSFFPDTTFSYDRTLAFQMAIRKKLKKAVIEHPNTDCFISTSFSFLPTDYTDKPCLLLCDWTYDYLISHFKKRKPDFFEKKGIEIQNSIIKKADYVFSLFPDVANYMKNCYPTLNISYLGNVINSRPFDLDISSFTERLNNTHIVFVGLPKYMEGLKSLVKAITILNERGHSISLDVIGMNASDYSFDINDNIYFHGYLEKSNPLQLSEYERILKTSLAFINTTPEWAGFSSTLEAMYYGVPVYTSKYRSFVETFGETLSFGDYCINNSAEEIVDFILNLLKMNGSEYAALCLNSRKKAEPFTWSAYVDTMLYFVESH